MVNEGTQEVKQLVDQAGGLSLGTDDFLIAIRTDSGELLPQLVGSVDDFLQRSTGLPGVDEICRCLAQQDRRGPFVGMLHSDGAALFGFPAPVIPEKLPPSLIGLMSCRALEAGVRVGEVYEIHLWDDGEFGMFHEVGMRKLRSFLFDYGAHFLDGRRRPRKQRAYVGIVWSGGAYLAEV